MKLYLIGHNAIVTAGANPRRIRIFCDGKASTSENGRLIIGAITVPVVNGAADLPVLRGCHSTISYHSNTGRRCEGAIKVRADGSVANSDDALDAALVAASKTDKLEADLKKLQDDLTDLKSKVEYQGLDFLINNNDEKEGTNQ